MVQMNLPAFARTHTNAGVGVLRGACIFFCAIWLIVVFVAVHAQAEAACREAAELWIPSSGSREKSVVKWKGPIKFEIIARERYRQSVNDIERELEFFSREIQFGGLSTKVRAIAMPTRHD
jgi:hypothetical protein